MLYLNQIFYLRYNIISNKNHAKTHKKLLISCQIHHSTQTMSIIKWDIILKIFNDLYIFLIKIKGDMI